MTVGGNPPQGQQKLPGGAPAVPTNPGTPSADREQGLPLILQALALGGQPIGSRSEVEAPLMQGSQATANGLARVDPQTQQQVQTPMGRLLTQGLSPQQPGQGSGFGAGPADQSPGQNAQAPLQGFGVFGSGNSNGNRS